MDQASITPMLKQYFEIKKQYPNTILFFRMGDFYEMFFDDAKTAAPILEVVLTTRNKHQENSVPLCGIPYHALNNYAAKLLRQGFKVAICEQTEDPAQAKGLVRREVTHVLTPATALEIDQLDGNLSNRVVAIFPDEAHLALAAIDLAAGDFEVKCFQIDSREPFFNEIYRQAPRELVVSKNRIADAKQIVKQFPEFAAMLINDLDESEFNYLECENILKRQFNLENIEGLGIQNYPAAVVAAGVLLKYLQAVRRTPLKNISGLRFVPQEDYLILDATTFRNLEVIANIRTGNAKGSLIDAVDFTVTPMGKRLLKRWLSYPLLQKEEIERRLDGIEELSQNLITRSEIRRTLKQFPDLARLNSRVSLNIVQPAQLLNLRAALQRIPGLIKEILPLKTELLGRIAREMDPLEKVSQLIETAISDDPPAGIHEGNVIKRGYHQPLDELRDISRNAKEIVAAMEKTERENTTISSLKIKYNKVFGYFIEVTKPHLKLVPPHYIRKQTLVNAERFLTAELKELEEKIFKAEGQIIEIEKKLYADMLVQIQNHSTQINRDTELLASLDVLAAGAELARRRNYCRPEMTEDTTITIQEGRHPVIETTTTQAFIPNDLQLDAASEQILIITGPNMGGKSTYLRQNSLIVILAQAGYFVPAQKAQIGLCDRIFTRIGASDSLIEGKSTFLVEMIETAVILNNATNKSLILLDEIGRGTSTFDGLSIAWSVIEHLHKMKERPRTLFATHYHELTELAAIYDRIKNCHITVKEWQDDVIFLHKIQAGSIDQSFGIHVAKIAGIPLPVIERSKEILLNLEKKELNRLVKERITGRIAKIPAQQKELFPDEQELKLWDEIREKLKSIDISNLTPLEALNILHTLKFKSDNLG